MTVRQRTLLALGIWFVAVAALGTAGGFVGQPGSPPLPLLFGATLPLAAFLAAYYGSDGFRTLVLSADLRLLSAIQGWRVTGLGFLALYANGVLPGVFAWPAGLGDIAIGLTAPWVALALTRERAFAGTRAFALWNAFGILDLLVAMSVGALSAGFLAGFSGDLTTAPMARMPLILIPACLVPLFVMLHLTAFFQAAAARGGRYAARAVPS
ncbi:MAG TPA: hypothetical protein VNE59_07005 [Burkholderiales bacterium]|nr:hypothetical protein [Burkholderiales bacterium]